MEEELGCFCFVPPVDQGTDNPVAASMNNNIFSTGLCTSDLISQTICKCEMNSIELIDFTSI